MPYSEMLIKPMREDLTRLGVEETRTPDAVDAVVQNTTGTVMVIVNSVCGCAAGKARPGIAQALKHIALVAGNANCTRILVAADNALQNFRIDPVSQFGEANHVAEQHGELAALAFCTD